MASMISLATRSGSGCGRSLPLEWASFCFPDTSCVVKSASLSGVASVGMQKVKRARVVRSAHGFVCGLVCGVHCLAVGLDGVLAAILNRDKIKLHLNSNVEQRPALGSLPLHNIAGCDARQDDQAGLNQSGRERVQNIVNASEVIPCCWFLRALLMPSWLIAAATFLIA